MSEQTGVVFNIQKFSLHDGPGIRTVVFLKGCPLRCRWCANPESQDPAPCQLENGLTLAADQQRMTAEETVKICLQDRDFYEESGGGVTLSGGEPLAQPDFAAGLLTKLGVRRVHTAIETTGYAQPAVFDRVTALADLLLFDMKHWDPVRHREGTGVDSRLILDNMARAIRAGKEVLPRLPVIPGYNDSLEDAAGFATRLREVGADRVQLLPFHQFGENKYGLLGREYAYRDVPALHEEDLAGFRQALLDAGINAFI